MGCIWTALGNRLETAWKRPTKPNSKRPKDGEMRVEAECWMNILDALDDNDIKMYVDNEYRPGLLNPFHKW